MIQELKDKKIAVVGMGTNNQMLVDFLRISSIDFEIIENWKSPEDLVGILDNFDVIFRTPGLPYLSRAIVQAKEKGAIISSQTKLFFELCPAKIIGVTGTKGKGTTSSLITAILKADGRTAWLGGNIGKDPFEFLSQIKPEDFVVLELSSFQLQDLEQSPHIAVVLSVTPDHLNHHKDFEEYIHAKSNIIAHQTGQDFAVLHSALPEWFKKSGNAKKIFIDAKKVANFERKLLGDHNLENIAAAVAVAQILEISEEVIMKAVASFEPLPHRLKLLRTVNEVNYVDDGFSTNIEPAMAAIDSIDTNIVMIVGGSDKGLDFTNLGDAIKNSTKVKGLVVIGQVTDKILKSLEGFSGQILTGATTMTEMISQAQKIAVSGDTILLSPATASFGLFKNEHDRAEQFVNAVNAL